MTTIERPKYRVVGTRPIRPDGVDKVTGRARYANDVQIAGHLYGKLLRSPHAHARILSIDTSRAEALPGVRAVVTGEDMAAAAGNLRNAEGGYYNLEHMSLNSFAQGKALFAGHTVAAVAADTEDIAGDALDLITVRYEVLPPLLNARDAMKEDAPVILSDLGMKTNFRSVTMEIGDLAAGFEAADLILERDYEIGAAHQGYIEPQAATAAFSEDGMLTVWGSSQGHFSVRDYTAVMLGLDAGQVKVIQAEIGGGFGGKLTPTVEHIAGALSRKAGKPVKIALSRKEVFDAQGATSSSSIHLKMGVTNDGKLTAAEAKLVYEAGAFPGSPVGSGAMCMFSPYDIPNARAEGFDVIVNKPKVTAYRAPGAPAGAMAVESMIDEFCEKLAIDPLDFRLKNAAPEGSRRVNGVAAQRMGYVETIEAAKAHPHLRAPIGGPNRGRGIAGGFWFNGSGPAAAIANVLPDGRVALIEGSPDIGGTRAAAAMQFAETLEIPFEHVRPTIGDTDSIGYTSATGGSGAAFKTGVACHEAALGVKREMIARAAMLWKVNPEDVIYANGVFTNSKNAAEHLTFREVAAKALATGGPIVARAAVSPHQVGNAYALHIADVEVDPDTGKVTVLRYTALQDAGTAIHPSYVEGQMQGGAAQGIGWALNEQYVYDAGGHMLNASYLDYRMPTALDLPRIDTVIIEVPNPGHPYGIRGVGEVPIVPPLAAIANAVSHAIGIRATTLPLTPRAILELKESSGNGAS